MAILIVQSAAVVNGGGGDVSLSPGSALTLGNTALIGVAWDGNDSVGTVPTASDSLGNVYSVVKSYVNNTPTNPSLTSIAVLAAPVTHAGSATITVAMSGMRGGAFALECSGLNNSALLDQFAEVQAASGTTLTTPSVTTTIADELLLAVGGTLGSGSPTMSASSGYTILQQGGISPAGAIAGETQIVSSTGTFTAGLTGMAGFNSLLLVALKAPGGGVAPAKPVVCVMQ